MTAQTAARENDMTIHFKSMTANALAMRADASVEFEHDSPALVGTLFFSLDREVTDCRHGYEYGTTDATLIGVLVTGDYETEFTAPEILDRDQAVDRFETTKVRFNILKAVQ